MFPAAQWKRKQQNVSTSFEYAQTFKLFARDLSKTTTVRRLSHRPSQN